MRPGKRLTRYSIDTEYEMFVKEGCTALRIGFLTEDYSKFNEWEKGAKKRYGKQGLTKLICSMRGEIPTKEIIWYDDLATVCSQMTLI